MKTKGCRFTVEGSGPFPFDMLRYDRCFPSTEYGSSFLRLETERRKVELTSDAISAPTVMRWLSFGWRVILESR